LNCPVIIVRPQPGASATAARLHAAGQKALIAPLFAAGPLPWLPPDPTGFDALLLTSANALRHGGPALVHYHGLPCWCVGAATAAAAAIAGFAVARIGDSNAEDLLAQPDAAGRRWLWLAGARHQPLAAPIGGVLTVVPVYASADLPAPDALLTALVQPAVLLAHSAAAAQRLQGMVTHKDRHHLVAISAAVATAAGHGWRSCTWPDQPDDSEMVAKAAMLCMDSCHE
jgi:uroporphyrinogen-III synthase